jgi:4-hydroxy-2-oxoheptanedioate aldolase
MRAGQVARVVSTAHFLPFYPRLAAEFGYDGVWVDSEHGCWDPAVTKAYLAYHHLADVDCLYRTPTREKSGLARLLEDGATGLMIPHVNDAALAAHLAECSKFPPLGDRGVDGAGVDGGFWVGKGDNYINDANEETFLCAQIETPVALANVDAIAATPGVDMLFLGPGDMSVRLGCTGSIGDPQIWDALEKIVAACRKHGKFAACPVGSAALAKRAVDLGVNLIAYGGEFLALMEAMKSKAMELDAVLGENRVGRAADAQGASA